MLPYIPRAPNYGGKLRKKKMAQVAEASSSATVTGGGRKKPNNLAPLSGGGPVECAIKKDLVALRHSFCSAVSYRLGSDNVNTLDSPLFPSHDAEGMSFRQFKDEFQRGKFGIIHTRCTPPRCDKADYQQLLYSACLGLLEETFMSETIPVGGRHDEGRDGRYLCDASAQLRDVACALFSLYTIYETNPQPSFPTDTDRGELNTLSMGLTSEDHSKGLHRRSYREPIRVTRKQYSLLHMVRDLSLEEVSLCDCKLATHWETTTGEAPAGSLCIGLEAAYRDEDRAPCDWRCSCGIARDCIQVLDRMRANNAFDYCEYAGPCSVEGLAGSAEYYQKVLEREAPGSSGTILSVSSNFASDTDQNLDGLSSIDISGIDSLCREYQESLKVAELRLAAQSGGGRRGGADAKKPREIRRIQHALVPVFSRGSLENRGSITNRLHLCFTESPTAEGVQSDGNNGVIAKGSQLIQASTASVENRDLHDASLATGPPIDTDASHPDEPPVDGIESSRRVLYPPKTHQSLKKGIDRALGGFLLKAVTTVRQKGATKKKGVRLNNSFPLMFEDEDVLAGSEEENLDGLSVGSVSDGSGESISRSSTLIGQNALNRLLSKATARSNGNAPGDNRSSISRDGTVQPALGALLAEVNGGTETRSSKRRPTTRKKTPSNVGVANYDTDSFMARDRAGRTALDTLLNEAKQKPPPKSKKRKASAQSHDCIVRMEDADSIATGDGAGAIGALLARVQADEQEPAALSKEHHDDCGTVGESIVARVQGDNQSSISRDGAGQAALGALLVEVNQGMEARSSERRPVVRKNTSSGVARVPCDNESFVTRDGAGRAALDTLLNEAKQKPNHNGKKRDASGQPAKSAQSQHDIMVRMEDADSIATGDGAGAIGALLARVNADKQVSKREQALSRVPDINGVVGEVEGGDLSVGACSSVATGAGGCALKNLLLRAKADSSK